jgi:hypothetical protein
MEAKEIFDIIGYTPKGENATKEELKEFIDNSYVGIKAAVNHPEITKQIAGKVLGSLDTTIKRIADIELDSETLALPVAERLPKIIEVYKAQIATLKEATGKSSDETTKALQSQLEKEQNRYKQAEGIILNLNKEKETLTQTLEHTKLSHQRDRVIDAEFGKLPFSEHAGRVAQIGLRQVFESSYDIAFENNQPTLLKKDGTKALNEKGTKELSISEALFSLAESENLLRKSTPPNQPPAFNPNAPVQTQPKNKVPNNLINRTYKK